MQTITPLQQISLRSPPTRRRRNSHKVDSGGLWGIAGDGKYLSGEVNVGNEVDGNSSPLDAHRRKLQGRYFQSMLHRVYHHIVKTLARLIRVFALCNYTGIRIRHYIICDGPREGVDFC